MYLRSLQDGLVVLGFDAEWDDDNRVALIQLSLEQECYLLHMSHIGSLTTSLQTILEDAKYFTSHFFNFISHFNLTIK
jgi:hypothetical protein